MLRVKKKNISRRQFLGSATATVTAFTIVPRHVLGGPGHTPPSEKLNIAGIGAGGMGSSDIRNVSSENIVALCDVDHRRAAPTFDRHPKARKYHDFRVMLEKEDKNIDAVTVSTPDNVHAVAAMMAIKMGKHVFVQKPMAHDVYEVRRLTEAARKYKVATQMGNQYHSGEGVRLICEWLWDGAIGPVREVHTWTNRPMGQYGFPAGVDRPSDTPEVPPNLNWDLWLGPAAYRAYHPLYVPFRWRGWWDFGTGALGDMGCHIMDSAFWALKLGSPVSVEASSTKVNSETGPLAAMVHYKFAARGDMPPVEMTWYDGGLMPPRPQELEERRSMAWGDESGGAMFIGDKGLLMCDHHGESPRLIPESKMKAYKRPAKTIQRSIGHHKEWLQACKGRKPAGSNFDFAGPLTEAVLMGNIAIRTGKKLYWDGPNMKVTNVPEANEYVRRQYRQGWSL